MAIVVNSIAELKSAINNGETKFVAGNKKTRYVLRVLSVLPDYVFATGASAAILTSGATLAMGSVALTTGQIWAIIAVGSIVAIIITLRTKHLKIRYNPKTGEFEGESYC